MTSRPPPTLCPTPQPPNLLSFHDIKLHSLPVSNAAQELPGVVSFNSCLLGEGREKGED